MIANLKYDLIHIAANRLIQKAGVSGITIFDIDVIEKNNANCSSELIIDSFCLSVM